jgi:drug/metabolite transporter (DMT)-like permease
MVTKFVGILPLTKAFKFEKREGMYTTLLMSTGLTFGSISALFGLTNHIIDETQYTILLTAVIGSAVVPTMIAISLFLAGLPRVGAARASLISTLELVVTVTLAILLLGDRFTLLEAFGGVLVLGAVVVVQAAHLWRPVPLK